MSTRPRLVVCVAGTDTEIGKTYVAAELLRAATGRAVARKPAQSFDAGSADPTDAEVLGAVTGEDPTIVCPSHRWYELPLAPPMAADALGRPQIAMADLVAELAWPNNADLGVVETVGGLRSPMAHDGDSIDLVRRVAPDLTVLVADAGLGTINAVRLSLAALHGLDVVIVLNRFETSSDLHRRNLQWLADDGLPVALPEDVARALPGSPG